MTNDLRSLRNVLINSPTARVHFLARTLDLFRDSGVDVDDPAVLADMDLDLNLTDGQKFVSGLAASSIVITITE